MRNRLRSRQLKVFAAAATASLAVLGALVSLDAPAGATTSDRLPDLVMAPLQELQFETTADGRRLLRYTAIIANAGSGPFEVRGARASGATEMSVTQRVFGAPGEYRDIAVSGTTMFYSGDGHNHWHVRDLEVSSLRADGGVTVAAGAKHGFCFMDNYHYNLQLPGAPQSMVYPWTACGVSTSPAVTMGLSIGWGDEYPYYIAYQYVDVTGVAPGEYILETTADPENWFLESDELNNSASIEVEIPAPSANLSVTMTDAPDPVTVGSNLTYSLTVRNAGPNTASDVTLSDTLPAGATYVSVSASRGTCAGTATVTCTLGSLANGAVATVTLVVRPGTAGTLSNTASVASSLADPVSSNNSASASTIVQSTPPPPTGITAFPGTTHLYNGSVRSGDATRLAADDGSFFSANSASGVSYWYGRVYGVPNALRNLRVTYSGAASRTCTQSLRVYNWTYARWTIFSTKTVGLTEVATTVNPTGTLSQYVSGTTGNGDVAIAVRCTRADYLSFYTSGDLMKITYDAP